MSNTIAQQLRHAAEDTPTRAPDMLAAADEIDRLMGIIHGSPLHVSAAGSFMQSTCYTAAKNAGWWVDTETGEDVRTWPDKFFKLWVGAKLALVHSEISEGLEGHRKNLMDDHLPTRRMLEVELADAVIRICDLAGGLAMDLGGAIAEKLAYNAQRADHKIENRIAEGGKSI